MYNLSDSITVQITMPEWLNEYLNKMAYIQNRDVSDTAMWAINDYIADYCIEYDIDLDEYEIG